jgi:hypothetical protein
LSALTKIFVVLLVILSIVETAGMVVWVNRSQNFTKTMNDQTTKLKSAQAQVGNLTDQIALIAAERTQIQAAMQKQIDSKQQEVDALTRSVTDRDTQIAQLNSNLAQVTAAQKSATDALTVAQKTVDQQNTAIAALRTSELELQKRTAEQSFAINDWTNKYDVVNRQERDDREQIAQLQGDNEKMRLVIHKAGIADGAAPRTINGEPLVRVEGVIRSAQNINGVPFATISVGAADQVTKGMQFKIIDTRARDPFLGYLIVDKVEPNEAIGHLTGPHVNEVHEGAEVRTQL